MLRSLKPFRVIADLPHSPVTDEQGTHNVDLRDHAIRARQPKRSDTTNHCHQQAEANPKTPQQFALCKLHTSKAKPTEEGHCTLEYTVDNIVKHLSADNNF